MDPGFRRDDEQEEFTMSHTCSFLQNETGVLQ